MTAAAAMEHVLLRDRLHLRLVDTGKAGTPVIFQHGLCGAEEQVAEVMPADHPRRRLTLECRGHGQSEAGDPPGFTIADFAEDVVAAAELRGVTNAVVGGISMGAALALRLAVMRPDLVRGVVLARPAWVTEAAPASMAPNGLVGDLLSRHSPAIARAVFETSPDCERLARDAPDNLASLRRFFSREPIAVTAQLLSRIAVDGPGVTRDQVSALSVPTLVIGHEQDAIHPLTHAKTLAGLIPGAKLVQITPKASDKTRYLAEFRRALDAFLERVA